jgi:hypothetical protein
MTAKPAIATATHLLLADIRLFIVSTVLLHPDGDPH